jgi:hypothetical protein
MADRETLSVMLAAIAQRIAGTCLFSLTPQTKKMW